MAISKYTLYKYVKVNGTWRYCKAAYHDNGKIKPDIVFVDVKQRLLEKYPEGRYYMNHNGTWIDAGTDALEAQRKRKQRLSLDEFNRLSGKGAAQSSVALPDGSGRITLAAATEKYFANCEARGLDPETIRKYRAAVDPFIEHCGATYVDECRDNKQVLLNYMGWLRKQPVRKRKHSNPERTLANRVGDVRIFLKEFGITKLLKKNEEPKYHEKKVVAHPDDELDVLYGAADAEETFLLDFFIGSMARDHEAYGKYGDPDLTGTTLTLYGKHHKTRTVEITQRLADGIRNRRKRNKSTRLFVNRNGKPDKHLLRKLQNLAKKAGAKFHTELHKLRKTGASRRYLANVPLPTLMLELGHESLAVTQDYLADVRKPGEAKKAVADADFIPKTTILEAIRLAKAIVASRTPNEATQALLALGAIAPYDPQRVLADSIARDPRQRVEIRCGYQLSPLEITTLISGAAEIATRMTLSSTGLNPQSPNFNIAFLASPQGKAALGAFERQLREALERVRNGTQDLFLDLQFDPTSGRFDSNDVLGGVFFAFLDIKNRPSQTVISYFPADRALPAGEQPVQLGGG